VRKLRFILLALALTAAGLLGVSQSFSSSQVDVRGAITRIEKGRDKLLGRVLIEGVKEPDTRFDKAFVDVTDETELFIKRGGERKPVEFAALKEKQRVEARFKGGVRESYPVQATAAEITILEK
jgi:hypothetical protein